MLFVEAGEFLILDAEGLGFGSGVLLEVLKAVFIWVIPAHLVFFWNSWCKPFLVTIGKKRGTRNMVEILIACKTC
jgi:hypothetical protein